MSDLFGKTFAENKLISMSKLLLSTLTIMVLGPVCTYAAAQYVNQSKAKVVFTFKGRVADVAGKGIAGVVVNDGHDFTTTDKKGNWKLVTDTTRSKFVSISVPAAYCLPERDGLVCDFYVSVGRLVGDGRHDFKLVKRRRKSDEFHYIAISDPQIANARDMSRWRSETVPELRHMADSLGKTGDVVGVTLGDLVFDNMNIWDEYRRSVTGLGMTFFECIGNHDFDKRYKALSNMPSGTPAWGEMIYNMYFGPTDYSFNIGKIHVVTMKNIDYDGGKRFTERITPAQIEWLRKDLSYVKKGTTVFLNMHAAAWNKVFPRGNIRNADRLKEVLDGYNVHVFSGHTHFYQNVVVNDRLFQHNIGAACGAWWGGWMNRCGAPNGYLVVDVNGNDVKWRYKATCRPFDFQMRLYGRGEFKSQPECVVANIWDFDTDCTVTWFQDGKNMGAMERFVDADDKYAASVTHNKSVVPTGHLFRARPDAGPHTVKVVFTNRFGEKYSSSITMH